MKTPTRSTEFVALGHAGSDHYAGLDRHLRSQFPCLLENERVIVFDLRGATVARGE